MNYNTAPTAPSYDEEEQQDDDTPICPTMDMVQHFLNQDHRYGDKRADEEEQDDGPSWD